MPRLALLSIGATVGGAGIGLLVFFLQMAEVDLPTSALILLGILAVLMILVGVVTILIALVGVSPLLTPWDFVRRIRLRVPLTLVSTSSVEPSGQKAPAVMFHPQTVRVSVSQVNLTGLLAEQSANECIGFTFNVANWSGFTVRVKEVVGHIEIDDERQRGQLRIESNPGKIPFPATRPVTLDQVTPGLRERLRDKGIYGKTTIIRFDLSHMQFVCDVTMPDGSVKEERCGISESSFLLRGPLRDEEDYGAVNRQSLSFGSNNWYNADGPNEAWYQTQ